jgi:glycosyltransferase involved in cell wall biosynthesis
MVSICLASYNGEKFIKEQIASILNQLAANDELIISDDNSTDNTLKVINSFQDTRIKLFFNEKVKGPVGNFENAISKANGDIIFLADQDDVWMPNKIKEHLELHRKYDLVMSDAVVVDENGNIIFESFFKARNSKKGVLNNLVKNSYIGCCISFNRKICNAALPFPPYIYMHDCWIGIIGELKGNVIFHEEKLIRYLRHSNNASVTLSQKLPLNKKISNRISVIRGLVHRSFSKISKNKYR